MNTCMFKYMSYFTYVYFYTSCAIKILIIVKNEKKYFSQSRLVYHYFRTFVKKLINSVLYVSINRILRNFQTCFGLLSRHFQRKSKKISLFSNLSIVNITLCRVHQWLIGNALRHIHTQLLKMSFIHHVSIPIRGIFPP